MRRRVAAGEILHVPYRNKAYPGLSIEPMRLSDLTRRMAPDHFTTFQRPEFHLLILFTAGRATHYLDFERVTCTPGTLLHVRPGQVQQFRVTTAAEAHIVLFTPEFIPHEQMRTETDGLGNLVDQVLPDGIHQGDMAQLRGVVNAFLALSDEYAETDGSPLCARILQHLLQTLLLRILRVSCGTGSQSVYGGYLRTFRRFAKLVDVHFSETRTVMSYARMLGCSEKTLNRACLACSDTAPKELIGRRVALEAKRLLAHTDDPIDRIAQAVGFSETTNFTKFFRSRERVGPTEFRGKFPGHYAGRSRVG